MVKKMAEKYEFVRMERNQGIAFSVWLNNETKEEEKIIIGEILNPDEV